MITLFSIHFYVMASIVIATIIVFLYVWLILKKFFYNRQQKRLQMVQHKLKEEILDFFETTVESRDLLHLSSDYYYILLNVLTDYMHVLASDFYKQRLTSYAEQKLTTWLTHEFEHSSYARRIIILSMIDTLKIKTLLPVIKKRILTAKHIRVTERDKLYRAWALHVDIDLFTHLVQEHAVTLPEYLYREMFVDLDNALFDAFISRFMFLERALRLCLIDIIGINKNFQYLSLIEQLTQSTDMEERIRAIVAIKNMGYCVTKNALIMNANSLNWYERMITAETMAVINDPTYIDTLHELVLDTSWRVRSAAIQALLSYEQGIALLSPLITQLQAKYTDDMHLCWIDANGHIHYGK